MFRSVFLYFVVTALKNKQTKSVCSCRARPFLALWCPTINISNNGFSGALLALFPKSSQRFGSGDFICRYAAAHVGGEKGGSGQEEALCGSLLCFGFKNSFFKILVVTQRDVFLRRKRLPEYQLIPISPEVSPIMQRAAAVFGNVILWYVETKHRTTLCWN